MNVDTARSLILGAGDGITEILVALLAFAGTGRSGLIVAALCITLSGAFSMGANGWAAGETESSHGDATNAESDGAWIALSYAVGALLVAAPYLIGLPDARLYSIAVAAVVSAVCGWITAIGSSEPCWKAAFRFVGVVCAGAAVGLAAGAVMGRLA